MKYNKNNKQENTEQNQNEISNSENLDLEKKDDFNLDFNGMTDRQIKINLELKAIAQDFFQRETNGTSLITITKAKISRDLKQATIYITVLPDNKEEEALNFAKRARTDLRTDIKKKLRIRVIPNVDVLIDQGEKVRQEMDKQFRKIK